MLKMNCAESKENTVRSRSRTDLNCNKVAKVLQPEQLSFEEEEKPQMELVWRNIAWYILLHTAGTYGLYLAVVEAKWSTVVFALFLHTFGKLGVTAGAHRLWSHKSYKAKLPLRLFLAAAFSVAMQNSILEWCRDHRVHHKFSETDADPHNAKRGFFFSHMGWLMCKKHPDVKRKGKGVSLADLEADPVVYWENKLNKITSLISCIVMPTFVPWMFFGESLWTSYFVAAVLTYVLSLHATWLVNSAAHMWGWKPYDKHISPVQNLSVSIAAIGEGWHNYHHTFPADYKTAELGGYATNLTTMFIDAMAWLGLAYDLKTVSEDQIKSRCLRTGDGTHPDYRNPDNSSK